jgi:hypothetical protein
MNQAAQGIDSKVDVIMDKHRTYSDVVQNKDVKRTDAKNIENFIHGNCKNCKKNSVVDYSKPF